ncbi:MAG: nucleotidyltransferase family protein [Verrucomicrobiota bacterium]
MNSPSSESAGAIVLAAGASKRLGRPKQLVLHNGKPLLLHTVECVLQAFNGPIFVILGDNRQQSIEALVSHHDNARLSILHFDDWQKGMGNSLAFGARKLTKTYAQITSILVTVCDQPHLSPQIVSNLLTKQQEAHSQSVVSSYADTIGPPVCFSRNDFPALMQLEGDHGAKKLLMDQDPSILRIPFTLGSIDIDTPEDYQTLLNPTQRKEFDEHYALR